MYPLFIFIITISPVSARFDTLYTTRACNVTCARFHYGCSWLQYACDDTYAVQLKTPRACGKHDENAACADRTAACLHYLCGRKPKKKKSTPDVYTTGFLLPRHVCVCCSCNTYIRANVNGIITSYLRGATRALVDFFDSSAMRRRFFRKF